MIFGLFVETFKLATAFASASTAMVVPYDNTTLGVDRDLDLVHFHTKQPLGFYHLKTFVH